MAPLIDQYILIPMNLWTHALSFDMIPSYQNVIYQGGHPLVSMGTTLCETRLSGGSDIEKKIFFFHFPPVRSLSNLKSLPFQEQIFNLNYCEDY